MSYIFVSGLILTTWISLYYGWSERISFISLFTLAVLLYLLSRSNKYLKTKLILLFVVTVIVSAGLYLAKNKSIIQQIKTGDTATTPATEESVTDIEKAYQEKNNALDDFLDYYDKYGGLGKEKSKILREKFDKALSIIQTQEQQFQNPTSELAKAYKDILDADEAFLLGLKPYIKFMEYVGPIFENVFLIESRLNINSMDELKTQSSYIEQKQKALEDWYDVLNPVDVPSGNLFYAKSAYHESLNMLDRYLESAKYAIKNSGWDSFEQAQNSFKQNYWEEAGKMASYLQDFSDDKNIQQLVKNSMSAENAFLALLEEAKG